jgi:hypothetical protein
MSPITPEDIAGWKTLIALMEQPEGGGSIIGRSFIVATSLSRACTVLLEEREVTKSTIRDLIAIFDMYVVNERKKKT